VGEALIRNPVVAYAAILVLQTRIMWNFWHYKDLTFGDTSYYYLDALSWLHGMHSYFAGSPGYTAFLALVKLIVGDVYAAVLIHRVLIVLAAAVLVLALLRSLLGPAMGFLVTIWWVVLPPNYNVEYEVHLFGLLPILVAALVASRAPSRARLGLSLAVLVGAGFLVREELVLASVILGVAIVIAEIRRRRRSPATPFTYARAYAVPLVVVALLVAGAWWRSSEHTAGIPVRATVEAHHRLNVCQAYAFNYQQRHPARFRANAMTDCAPLMRRQFGRDMPTFLEAVRLNPGAIADFVGWNARLLPSGLEVALFGATSTGDTPDYFPVKTHRSYALALLILLLGVIAAGVLALTRERSFWRTEWLPTRAWSVLILCTVGFTAVVVALTQRPRAEYIYGLTIGLLALTGICLSAIVRRLGVESLVGPVTVSLAIMLVLVVPSHYHRTSRPLHDAVQRLQVIRPELNSPTSVLVTSSYNTEICNYLAEIPNDHCSSPAWPALSAQLGNGLTLRRVLDHANATAIYADPLLQQDPRIAKLVASPRSAGWRRVSGGVASDGPWSVLVRA
jgi:hypothetical protein